MVHFLGLTEGQPQKNCMYQSQDQSTCPESDGQDRARSPVHDDSVLEGTTKRRKPIIEHHHERQALDVSKSQIQKCLHYARNRGEGSIQIC